MSRAWRLVWSHRSSALTIAVALGLVALFASGAIRASHGVREAGPVEQALFETGSPAPEGTYRFPTVRTREIGLAGWLLARFSGAEMVELDSDQAAAERASAAEMRAAQSTAWAVAGWLLKDGTEPGSAPGLVVTSVESASAAERSGLRVGDVILSVDGAPARSTDQLVDASDAAGQVRLEVAAGEQRRFVVVPPGEDGRLGVRAVPVPPDGGAPSLRGQVGGPSAGLMLTLAYLDARGSGDLSGPWRIAGTGTVASDGSVGSVGGIELKAQGLGDGIDVFFVPSPLISQVEGRTPARVVAVSHIGDALKWLCGNGVPNACPLALRAGHGN